MLVAAARVRSSRAAQQVFGLISAVTLLGFTVAGTFFAGLRDGWGLLALTAIIALLDVVALELAPPRSWKRAEIIACI